MSDHDLPPEFRQRSSYPEAVPLELPLDEDVTQIPLQNPDRASADEQRNPEPFLRRN
jgi:hypothetical protein